jgi:putative ABC transport system permease protein
MYNNFKTAFRNLKKHKLNSLIKILGVTTSLITLLFIIVFVKYELSYDKHIVDSQNIYRIVRNWQESETFSPSTPAMLTTELNHSFYEIESSTRLIQLYDANFVANNNVFYENNAIAVDSSFFITFNL